VGSLAGNICRISTFELFLISEYSEKLKSDKYGSREYKYFSLVPTFYAISVTACRFYGFLRAPIVGSSLWPRHPRYEYLYKYHDFVPSTRCDPSADGLLAVGQCACMSACANHSHCRQKEDIVGDQRDYTQAGFTACNSTGSRLSDRCGFVV